MRSKIQAKDQMWLFWIIFVAFAIKMPIWPLHTWQPDTYEQVANSGDDGIECANGEDGRVRTDPLAGACCSGRDLGLG